MSSELNLVFEVIIVDNASTDKTREVLSKIIDKYSCVKYVYIPEKGVGAAIQKGWLLSRYKILAFMDADLSTEISFIKHAVEEINNNFDLVVGSRHMKRSIVQGRSSTRVFISICYNLLLKMLFSLNINDASCGFKFIKNDSYKKLLNKHKITAKDWFFEPELLIKAKWKNIETIEMAVNWNECAERKSSVQLFRTSWMNLKHMLRLLKEKNEFD